MSCDCWDSVVLLPNAVGWYAASNCAISWSYSFTYCDSISCDGIVQRLVLMPDMWFMQMASGFMQLAATGCRRNILHCHCLFEGKCYFCIRKEITILKIIIWVGISLDMRSELTFLALLSCHRQTKFSFHMSNDNHPKWEFWIQLSPQCFCFNYYLFHGVPTSPLVQIWIKTHRCLACKKDP